MVEGADSLDLAHLVKAYQVMFPGQNNPFKEKPESLLFSEVSRYSDYNPLAVSEEEAFVPTQFIDSLSLNEILKKS